MTTELVDPLQETCFYCSGGSSMTERLGRSWCGECGALNHLRASPRAIVEEALAVTVLRAYQSFRRKGRTLRGRAPHRGYDCQMKDCNGSSVAKYPFASAIDGEIEVCRYHWITNWALRIGVYAAFMVIAILALYLIVSGTL